MAGLSDYSLGTTYARALSTFRNRFGSMLAWMLGFSALWIVAFVAGLSVVALQYSSGTRLAGLAAILLALVLGHLWLSLSLLKITAPERIDTGPAFRLDLGELGNYALVLVQAFGPMLAAYYGVMYLYRPYFVLAVGFGLPVLGFTIVFALNRSLAPFEMLDLDLDATDALERSKDVASSRTGHLAATIFRAGLPYVLAVVILRYLLARQPLFALIFNPLAFLALQPIFTLVLWDIYDLAHGGKRQGKAAAAPKPKRAAPKKKAPARGAKP